MMYPPQKLTIQTRVIADDGIGGKKTRWHDTLTVYGYIDMLTGDDAPTGNTNAFIEQSTHLCVLPDYTERLTDDMRVVDSAGRVYDVTYVDDPVGVHHHNELYLKYGGGE